MLVLRRLWVRDNAAIAAAQASGPKGIVSWGPFLIAALIGLTWIELTLATFGGGAANFDPFWAEF